MKKYRIQSSLTIVDEAMRHIKLVNEVLNPEDKLFHLSQARRLFLIVYNTMRSLHD